jgi:hypothetical protein
LLGSDRLGYVDDSDQVISIRQSQEAAADDPGKGRSGGAENATGG